MSVGAAATGLVRPRYRPPARPEILTPTEILERDLGIAMDEADQLRTSLKQAQAAFASATARLKRQSEIIDALQAAPDKPAAETVGRLRQTISALRETIAGMRQPAVSSPSQCFTVGRLTLDLTVQALVYDGREAALSPGEIQVLICLFERPGAVIRTTDLIGRMQGQHSRFSIRSYIRRIRVKLEGLGAAGYINSRRMWGMGGYWVAEPGAPS